MNNRTTHTGQELQRPVDQAARAKRLAAQERRIAKAARQVQFEKNLAALRAKYAKKEG